MHPFPNVCFANRASVFTYGTRETEIITFFFKFNETNISAVCQHDGKTVHFSGRFYGHRDFVSGLLFGPLFFLHEGRNSR